MLTIRVLVVICNDPFDCFHVGGVGSKCSSSEGIVHRCCAETERSRRSDGGGVIGVSLVLDVLEKYEMGRWIREGSC